MMKKDIKPKYFKKEYWKNYMEFFFGKDLIQFWEDHGQEKWIRSNDSDLHIEIYENSDEVSPTLIFSHGIAGYARLLLPFIKPLYKKGVNIIAPDLMGYGYNKGKRGKFEFNLHVENLVDTLKYANKNFKGKILLGGGSMGGPLAYSAAARYGNIDGLVCFCLFDFQDEDFIEDAARFGKYTPYVLKFLKPFRRIIGNMLIKNEKVISYDGLSIPELVDMIKKDPHSGTKLTINAAISLLTQSIPEIRYEQWKTPTLVLQPGADRMTPPDFARKVYEKLGSSYKKYVEIEGAEHYPTKREHYEIWASEVSKFIENL